MPDSDAPVSSQTGLNWADSRVGSAGVAGVSSPGVAGTTGDVAAHTDTREPSRDRLGSGKDRG